MSVKSEMNNGYFTCRLQVGRSRVLFPMMSLEVFIDNPARPHYGPGVDSASNRNENQECFLGGGGKCGWCVGLTNLSPSCADCHEIWEPQAPGTMWAWPGL